MKSSLVGAGLTCGLAALLACQTTDPDRTAEGVVGGAAAGAVAGMVAATIFGGNVGTGAAVGAAVGGVAGGAHATATAPPRQPDGPSVPGDPPEVTEAYLERLRSEVGPSAWAGLEALAECRHDEALTWGDAAQHTENRDHALAGLWLKAIAYEDSGRETEARAMLREIVEQDPRLSEEATAERRLGDSVLALRDIRVAYGQPDVCA